MADESMIKIISALGLDYNPAIEATSKFQKTIASLNADLEQLKLNAIASTKGINSAFTSQIGGANNKQLLDQYGNVFKTVNDEASKMKASLKDSMGTIKQSTLEQMKAQAASVQQRTTTKGLSQEYAKQASDLREQLNLIQSKLQAEGKLTAEEVKQTQELKEQLKVLQAQTKTAVSDDIRENPSTLKQEWERRSSWFLTGAMFYGTINAAKEVQATIKDVEMGMVEIARVMTDSSFVFDDYRDKLLQLGVEYGQTFDTVQAIALRWAQSGYNVADSLELTRTSLLALNTAELDAQQATESMIGIMAQWQLQAEDMALVMDKVNITADRHAVTSQDLVDGLLRSSGAARIMNLSLDETLGLLTVMREASGRTGREVGNALNSILSYIQRPGSINTLEGLGINVFADEAKTQFRNILDVFKEIAVNWGSLSSDIQDGFVASADEAGLFNEEIAAALGSMEQWNDLQQRDIAQASAGVYRRNYFIGMIERLSNVQGVLNNLMDAEGHSMRENEKTMDTLEKKMQSLKTSTEALAVAIGDAGLVDSLKAIVDISTGAVNSINNLDERTKNFLLSSVATFTGVKTLELGLKTFGLQLPNINKVLRNLTDGVDGLRLSLMYAKDGAVSFVKANAWLIALSASIGVIVAVTNHVKRQREETEKAVEVFSRQKEIANTINSILPQYEELKNKTNLTAEEESKLADVKQRIIQLLPKSQEALENENMSLETQLQIVKDLNEEEMNRAKLKAMEVVSKHEKNYDFYKSEVEEAGKAVEYWTKIYEDLYQRRDSLSNKEQMQMRNAALLIKAQTERYEDYQGRIDSLDTSHEILNGIINNQNVLLDENTQKTDANQRAKEDQAVSLDNLTEAFNNATSQLQGYYSMLDELNSVEGLSATSKQKIVSEYKNLLPYLSDEAELRKHLISIIEDEEKTQQDAYISMISSSEEFYNFKIRGNSELIDSLNEYYGVDLDNFKSLAEAKGKIEIELVSKLSGVWAKYYNAIKSGNANTEFMLENMVLKKRGNWQEANEVLSMIHMIGDMENQFNKIALELGGVDFKGITNKSSSTTKGNNSELDNALKMLEHTKKLSEETQDTIKAEIAELYRINSAYTKTQQERMDMAERIYAAEKRLRDRTLQDSVNWINEMKNLGQLSIEEEIAAWERVKTNQINNINAVKQATVELYKLRSQVMAESANFEENTIKHLTKVGVLGIQEQIDAYRKLYSVKATSLDEERSRVENLFSLYKSLLREQQGEIREAYDERLKRIDEEAQRKKSAQDKVIEGIERELELLNQQEETYDHNQKMAELREQLAYWQVRTSEDARKKVAEIQKQIAETERKREVDLHKQSLEDKKKVAQDEIKSIEDTAKQERERWEKSYKLVEKSFDEHSSNIVALAASMSKEAYEEWLNNYIIPMKNALSSGGLGRFESTASSLSGSISDLNTNVANSNNAQIYRLANSILDLKRQYEYGGDKSAADRAVPIYDQLSRLSTVVANRLHASNYMTAKDYIDTLPRAHTGALTMSYGAAYLKPGELIFPPDLSIKLNSLIDVLQFKSLGQLSSSMTDNRKEIVIGTLLNIERNYMEDDIDSDILARQLERALTYVY